MSQPNTSIRTGAFAPPQAREAARSGRTLLGWLTVLVSIALQYALFAQFIRREIVWSFPAYHDQVAYLTQAYGTYEHILDRGLKQGLQYGLSLQVPNGFLMHLQSSLLFLFLGANRSTALLVNFLYFALFQIVLVMTMRWLTRRWSLTFLSLGLLLTSISPFFFQGGIDDFRLDFVAFCLFGVVLCLAIRSRAYADRRWAAVCGLAASWLILFRFITVVYLGAIFALFLPCVLFRWWRRRHDPLAALTEKRRLGGLLLAGTIVAVVTVPVLWERREAIQAYYVFGHITGPEKEIRRQKVGNLCAYYPLSLVTDHLGSRFVKLGALALVAGLLVSGLRRKDAASRPWLLRCDPWSVAALAAAVPAVVLFLSIDELKALTAPTRLGQAGCWGALALVLGVIPRLRRSDGGLGKLDGAVFALCGLALFVPLAILTVNSHRSPVVANIAVPSVLWLTLLAALAALGRTEIALARPVPRLAVTILGGVALAAGLFTQIERYSQHTRSTRNRRDMEEILKMYDFVEQCCEDFQWDKPIISATSNIDYLHHQAAQVLMYERHGKNRTTFSTLGSNVVAVSEAETLAKARRSDVLLFTHPSPPVYPFEHSMEKVAPRLQAWCEQNLIPMRTFRIFDEDVIVYVRPAFKVEGDSRGWITQAGLTLKGSGKVLRQCRHLRLRGESEFALLDRTPHVAAHIQCPGKSPRSLPATIDRQGRSYSIAVDLSEIEASAEESILIRIAFDTYFIPREKGLNPDSRKLVIRTPSVVELMP